MAVTNIVHIVIDDLFAWYLHRDTFGQTIRTPNLDAFMAQSVVFNRFYAVVPICGPVRAAAYTGLSPFQSGIIDYSSSSWDRPDLVLPRDFWAWRMKAAGYHTNYYGKVRAEYVPDPDHVQRLLQSEPTVISMSNDKSLWKDQVVYPGGFGSVGILGDPAIIDPTFGDGKVSRNGIDFLNRQTADRPFYLELGFAHPHSKYECPDRFYQMYDHQAIRVPGAWNAQDTEGNPGDVSTYAIAYIIANGVRPEQDFELWQGSVQGYFASISHVDHEFGNFRAALAASPFADNTAVVLWSDHGFHLGDKNQFSKFSPWDMAGRAPCMICLPGVAPQTIETPVSSMDMAKTMLQLAGIDAPEYMTAGQSMLPLIQGAGYAGSYTREGALTAIYGTFTIRTTRPSNGVPINVIRYPNGDWNAYSANDLFEAADIWPTFSEAEKSTLATRLASALDEHGMTLDPSGGEITLGSRKSEAMQYIAGQPIHGRAEDSDYWVFNSTGGLSETGRGGQDKLYITGHDGENPIPIPEGIEQVYIAAKASRTDAGKAARFVINAPTKRGQNLRIFGGDSTQAKITTTAGDDWIRANRYWSNDIDTGAGNDTVIGGEWDETVNLGSGDDAYLGGSGRKSKIIDGGLGDDLITSSGIGDWITGGGGNDTISVSASGDGNTLDGGAGNDDITGSKGRDTIIGGDGADKIDARDGDDVLYIGGGDDVRGGPGADDFYVSADGGVTIIRDFEPGQDEIDITAWSTGGAHVAGQLTPRRVTVRYRTMTLVVEGASDFTRADVLAALTA